MASRRRTSLPPEQSGSSALRSLPERVACVWLPHFAVRAERLRRPEPACGPLALVGASERGGSASVRACSPEARAAGLAVGMPAHAIPQRCPGTVILPFDTAHYQRRYEELLAAFDAVSPVIEAEPLEVFYLDLTGLPRLDGREPEAVAAAVRAVVPPPFTPRLGIASGKFTAWAAAARAGTRPVAVEDGEKRRFLQDAPASLLPASEEVHRQLHQMGLRTLGRIAALPRSAMLARFGWAGERLHRLACGEDREPLTPYRAAPAVRETWPFPSAPTTTEFFVTLREVLHHAWARPERGERGVRQVRIEAEMEEGGVWERRVTLRQPTERPENAFSELKRRLEARLPAGPVAVLTVELTLFASQVDGQRLLFEDERVRRRERLKRELEHLRERGRLAGRPPVYRIMEVDPWALLPEEIFALTHYDP